jgi:hypothetical protein
MNPDNLFSIDVDSHLEKLTHHTYRSRSHYPVELVRLALLRGANKITVNLNNNRVEIRDNGTGIEDTLIHELKSLMQASHADDIREQAILNLQNSEGIGLLAIFSPSPSRIVIENSTPDQEHYLDFQEGKLRKFSRRNSGPGTEPFVPGTRILLYRKGQSRELEIKILKEYCRGVVRNILLNGQPISQQTIIRNQLAWMKFDHYINEGMGEVGIPKQGDVCRIWLLSQGIPLARKIIAPWRGFVFDAAIEYSDDLTTEILDRLLTEVRGLYQHLMTKYPKLPALTRQRIEELIFKHHRLSGDSTLVEKLAAFPALNSPRLLTLPQLRELASGSILLAIPPDAPVSEYQNIGKPILQLSQQQADYLVNHANVPIRFLPLTSRHSRTRIWISGVMAKWKSKYRRITRRKGRLLPPDQLSDQEKNFSMALSRYLNRNASDFNTPLIQKTGFINGWGRVPGWLLTDETGLESSLLVIRRKHALVRKAMESVSRNPENIEYIGPLFR